MNASIGGHRLLQRACEADEAAEAETVKDKATELYNDPEWRAEWLKGVCSKVVDEVVFRMLDALPHAVKEQSAGRDPVSHYSTQAILSCLHIIERQAKADAREHAQSLAEAGEFVEAP